MPIAPQLVEFTDDDVAPVAMIVDELQRAGAGWVNLDPEADPDDLPPPSGLLASLFAGRGPAVPRATWLAATLREPATVGIQHGLGQHARRTLAQFGLDVPAGWRVVQDHPRRGLVAHVGGDDHHANLTWLVGAATALATVTLTGHWQAEVHRR